MRKKITIGFVVIIVATAAIFFAVASKVYPVATVNDALISARSFQAAATAAQNYYGAIGAEYGGLSGVDRAEFESRMRQVALQALIEDELVSAQLLTMFEKAPLETAISARVNEAMASSNEIAAQAIPELFGITVDQFIELVLAPQARIELLKTELEGSSIDLETWLQVALQSAQVSITANDLVWQNGRVELSGQRPYTAEVKELFEELASTTEAIKEMASSTPEQ